MADNGWIDRFYQNVGQPVGEYLSRSYEGLGRGAHEARQFMDRITPGPETLAGFLPGAGIVQGFQDTSRARQAMDEGRYKDAVIDFGLGLVNAGTDMVPFLSAVPPIKGLHPDYNYGSAYYRRTNAGPDTGAGLMQFSKDPSSIEAYGKNLYAFDPVPSATIDANSGDLRRAAYRKLRESGDDFTRWTGLENNKDNVRSIVDLMNPDRIVDTAGTWDNPDISEYLWNSVLDPKGWGAVTTRDGAVVFDPDLVKTLEAKAAGGAVEKRPDDFAQMERAGYHHLGLFDSPIPGRTDKLPVTVPAGAYVIPADIVSALGEGNTLAGAKILSSEFGEQKPRFAAGGGVQIVAAGGEYVVPPDLVKSIGDGDIDHGHDVLDAFVNHVREQTIKTLKKLPGPQK